MPADESEDEVVDTFVTLPIVTHKFRFLLQITFVLVQIVQEISQRETRCVVFPKPKTKWPVKKRLWAAF